MTPILALGAVACGYMMLRSNLRTGVAWLVAALACSFSIYWSA